MTHHPDLSVDVGRLKLINPVMTASGTFGYAKEFQPFVALDRLGAIIVKGLSLQPSYGNPPQRIVETPCGMLNAIGLQNVGFEAFVDEKLPFIQTLRTPVLVNVYGQTIEEYAELANRLNALDDIAGIELNISCPNVKAGGVAFGVDPESAYAVVQSVRQVTDKPLMVKLSPNVTDITEIAHAVEGAGADAISLINTLTGMAIDIETQRPRLANITGGLSGPAIKPIALRMVWQVAQTVKVPIIGIGGIMTASDAIEFLIAGATAIQIGTANFINPGVSMEIIDGIEKHLIAKKINRIMSLVGSLQI